MNTYLFFIDEHSTSLKALCKHCSVKHVVQESSKQMNNLQDPGPKTFEELIDQHLEPDSKVYSSLHIGKNRLKTLYNHENTSELIISERDMSVTTYDLPGIDPTVITSVKEYLEYRHGPKSGFDAEFLTPPWPYTEQISRDPDRVRELVQNWSKQSSAAVNSPGLTYYDNKIWDDPRVGLNRLNLEIEVDDVETDTYFELSKYFDRVEIIEGEDYSGVLAERH